MQQDMEASVVDQSDSPNELQSVDRDPWEIVLKKLSHK